MACTGRGLLTAAGVVGMAWLLALPPMADAWEPAEKLPEGPGLAAKYPGDVGIDKDPKVVFVENFEHPSMDDLKKRWESVSHPEILSLADDHPSPSGGKRSLLVRHVGGKSNGGHLYRRLPPGHDKLFVRFYVKFDRDCAPIHHFFHVGGYNPPTPYPQGGAGSRPRGDERFSVGIEPFGRSWKWDYYTYWMEMRGSPPRGQTWGNNFLGDAKPRVARDKWVCVEAMIKMNDVGDSNGELALWIDGKRVSHLGKGFPKGKWIFDKFRPDEGGESIRWDDEKGERVNFRVPAGGKPFEGFRWRKDKRLKLNFLWLLVYITGAPKDHVSKIWFDDVVVAREYIGPLAKPRGKKEEKNSVRIGTAQPRRRLIDHRVKSPAKVLAQVDRSLKELEALVDKAGTAGCDALALPEDTLGLGTWEAGNPSLLKEVLPAAVKRMLDRLGRAAAAHRMYLVCCNDTVEEGAVRNTAFLLGRDGKEIGRYHKVNMPIHELDKKRGDHFPVFHTPDLGDVGMLICYDMVFPEAARCLALGGADIIFHPTLGGAAIGDGDISRAAFRTRAVENYVYVVVSQRGSGSMIISPKGKVLVEGKAPDDIAIADIDPSGGREGGDAFNHQRDMRARLFRERSPAAFGILTDPNPPVLKKVPETVSIPDAVRIARGALTVGEGEFQQADALLHAGKTEEAVRAFEALIAKYPATWIDRVARERLARVKKEESRKDR
jgi:predicted amidohydrolase